MRFKPVHQPAPLDLVEEPPQHALGRGPVARGAVGGRPGVQQADPDLSLAGAVERAPREGLRQVVIPAPGGAQHPDGASRRQGLGLLDGGVGHGQGLLRRLEGPGPVTATAVGQGKHREQGR